MPSKLKNSPKNSSNNSNFESRLTLPLKTTGLEPKIAREKVLIKDKEEYLDEDESVSLNGFEQYKSEKPKKAGSSKKFSGKSFGSFTDLGGFTKVGTRTKNQDTNYLMPERKNKPQRPNKPYNWGLWTAVLLLILGLVFFGFAIYSRYYGQFSGSNFNQALTGQNNNSTQNLSSNQAGSSNGGLESGLENSLQSDNSADGSINSNNNSENGTGNSTGNNSDETGSNSSNTSGQLNDETPLGISTINNRGKPEDQSAFDF